MNGIKDDNHNTKLKSISKSFKDKLFNHRNIDEKNINEKSNNKYDKNKLIQLYEKSQHNETVISIGDIHGDFKILLEVLFNEMNKKKGVNKIEFCMKKEDKEIIISTITKSSFDKTKTPNDYQENLKDVFNIDPHFIFLHRKKYRDVLCNWKYYLKIYLNDVIVQDINTFFFNDDNIIRKLVILGDIFDTRNEANEEQKQIDVCEQIFNSIYENKTINDAIFNSLIDTEELQRIQSNNIQYATNRYIKLNDLEDFIKILKINIHTNKPMNNIIVNNHTLNDIILHNINNYEKITNDDIKKIKQIEKTINDIHTLKQADAIINNINYVNTLINALSDDTKLFYLICYYLKHKKNIINKINIRISKINYYKIFEELSTSHINIYEIIKDVFEILTFQLIKYLKDSVDGINLETNQYYHKNIFIIFGNHEAGYNLTDPYYSFIRNNFNMFVDYYLFNSSFMTPTLYSHFSRYVINNLQHSYDRLLSNEVERYLIMFNHIINGEDVQVIQDFIYGNNIDEIIIDILRQNKNLLQEKYEKNEKNEKDNKQLLNDINKIKKFMSTDMNVNELFTPDLISLLCVNKTQKKHCNKIIKMSLSEDKIKYLFLIDRFVCIFNKYIENLIRLDKDKINIHYPKYLIECERIYFKLLIKNVFNINVSQNDMLNNKHNNKKTDITNQQLETVNNEKNKTYQMFIVHGHSQAKISNNKISLDIRMSRFKKYHNNDKNYLDNLDYCYLKQEIIDGNNVLIYYTTKSPSTKNTNNLQNPTNMFIGTFGNNKELSSYDDKTSNYVAITNEKRKKTLLPIDNTTELITVFNNSIFKTYSQLTPFNKNDNELLFNIGGYDVNEMLIKINNFDINKKLTDQEFIDLWEEFNMDHIFTIEDIIKQCYSIFIKTPTELIKLPKNKTAIIIDFMRKYVEKKIITKN